MSALVQERYGPPADVLELRPVETPVPGEGRARARPPPAPVSPADWPLTRGEPYLLRLIAGVRAPKDPRVGGEFAGTVEAVGPGVAGFAVGDHVFGLAAGSFGGTPPAQSNPIP